MNFLYIGNVLPMETVNKYRLSVAGKKYELNLLKNMFNSLEDEDRLDIISLESIGRGIKLDFCDSYWQVSNLKFPIISDFTLYYSLIPYLFNYVRLNRNNNIKIVVLNSPVILSVFLFILRFFFSFKMFTLSIDSPLASLKFSYKKLILIFYYRIRGSLSIRCINLYDGILGLNQNLKNLFPKKKFLLTKIGVVVNNNIKSSNCSDNTSDLMTVVYAGTLIEYNGITELLDSFVNLEDFQLHIYGYGPLEATVIEYSKNYTNIHYYGSVENSLLPEIYNNADVLINLRKNEKGVEYFGFPSKLIEYLNTGKIVVSSMFSSLPTNLKSFLILLPSLDINDIRKALCIIKSDQYLLKKRSRTNIDELRSQYDWKLIVNDFISFIKGS